MARFLFLDVDGVLNGHVLRDFVPDGKKALHKAIPPTTPAQKELATTFSENDSTFGNVFVCELDPAKVGMLADIVNSSGTQVVLSSSWRSLFNIQEMDVLLNWVCPSWKVGTIISATPYDDGQFVFKTRADEVMHWLKTTNNLDSQFVIVDDIDFGFTETFSSENLLLTEGDNGLTVTDMRNLMMKLGLRKAGKLRLS